jgi:ATP-binding cassette subfamily F protein uup
MPSILQFESVSKYIGEIILFEDVNFVLNEGEKSALIGLNGTGKTSLLNLITGMDAPDHGMIEIHTGLESVTFPRTQLSPAYYYPGALFSEGNDNLKCIKAYEESLLRQDVPALEKCTAEMDRLKLWDYETLLNKCLPN